MTSDQHVVKFTERGGSVTGRCSCGWERECWVGKLIPSNTVGVPPVVVGTLADCRRVVRGYAKMHRLAGDD